LREEEGIVDGKGKGLLGLFFLDTFLLRGENACGGKERRSIDGNDGNDLLQKKGYHNERNHSLDDESETDTENGVEGTYLFTSSLWV